MRTFLVRWTAVACVWVFAAPSLLLAQSPQVQDAAAARALRAEIDQLREEFQARIAALEARLVSLGGGPAAPAIPPLPQPDPAVVAPPTNTAPLAGSKIFNPDIAVIGNFIGAVGQNDLRPEPVFGLPESEMSLQAVVDPYARADFFFAFGEEGVGVEEGYLSFPTLPGGLLMKVGRMRAAFGKVNTLHTHARSWADVPLVTENLVAGEEGLTDAGVSVARLISNPWFFLEATGQVFRGESGDLFAPSRRGDLSYVGRLRGYQDITEGTNLDVGASFTRGHNASGVEDGVDVGRFMTSMFSVDATFRWRPLRRSIYRSFLGRSEVIWSRRDQPGGRQQASGFYVSGDYQMGRRWLTGLRLDRSDRAEDASAHDSGTSWTLTFRPSEFSQVRGQVRRTRYAEGVTAHELLFQVQFAIGAHGGHPF